MVFRCPVGVPIPNILSALIQCQGSNMTFLNVAAVSRCSVTGFWEVASSKLVSEPEGCQCFPYEVFLIPPPHMYVSIQSSSQLCDNLSQNRLNLLLVEKCTFFTCHCKVIVFIIFSISLPPSSSPPLSHHVSPFLCVWRLCLNAFVSFPCVCVLLCGRCLPQLVEGEYCPWEQELQSGIWLENLQDEEDTCRFKGSTTACGWVLQFVHWT